MNLVKNNVKRIRWILKSKSKHGLRIGQKLTKTDWQRDDQIVRGGKP